MTAFLLASAPAWADIIITETNDPATRGGIIADTVVSNVGGGVTIESVTVVGADGQAGTFTNGLSTGGFIDFEAGVILSSGSVSSVLGPNVADGTGEDMPTVAGADGDPDFNSLTLVNTFDAVYVEITFIPVGDTMTGTFVFASDEYNEYAPPAGESSAGNQFFDVMGFFVNGVNFSTTADQASGSGVPVNVSINTVNKTYNAADFVNNDPTDFPANALPFDIEADGFTSRLSWTAPVNPGVENTLKFGVADGGDAAFNSWLLIDRNSFRVLEPPADVDLVLEVDDNRLQEVPDAAQTVATSLTNLGPEGNEREILITYTLPVGITINGGASAAVAEGGVNRNEWICTSDAATPRQGVVCKSITRISTTPGNDSTFFTFDLDPIPAGLVGQTLVIDAVVSGDDNDLSPGNDSASDSTLVVGSDTTAPTPVIDGMPTITGSTSPIPVTVTFDEPVTGLVLSDFVVSGATASDLAIVDSTTATLTLTPDASGDIVLTLPAGAVQDAASNDSVAAGPVTTVYDASAPALSIDGAPGVVGTTTNFEVTFVFSEAVDGFVLGDVLVENGLASDLVMVDALTWTAPIDPDNTGDITVSVPAGAAQAADNGIDSEGDSVTVTLNASAPMITLSGAPTLVNSTDPWTVTVAFDEAVTGFELDDILVDNAAVSNLQAVPGTDSWTVVVTPDGTGDIGFSVVEGAVVDAAAGNPNPPSETLVTVYDDVAPTASFSNVPTWVNDQTPYTATLTFSEPVPGLVSGDLIVTNATLSNLATGDDIVHTFTVTPTGSGEIGRAHV